MLWLKTHCACHISDSIFPSHHPSSSQSEPGLRTTGHHTDLGSEHLASDAHLGNVFLSGLHETQAEESQSTTLSESGADNNHSIAGPQVSYRRSQTSASTYGQSFGTSEHISLTGPAISRRGPSPTGNAAAWAPFDPSRAPSSGPESSTYTTSSSGVQLYPLSTGQPTNVPSAGHSTLSSPKAPPILSLPQVPFNMQAPQQSPALSDVNSISYWVNRHPNSKRMMEAMVALLQSYTWLNGSITLVNNLAHGERNNQHVIYGPTFISQAREMVTRAYGEDQMLDDSGKQLIFADTQL